jgi:hypothetical protein
MATKKTTTTKKAAPVKKTATAGKKAVSKRKISAEDIRKRAEEIYRARINNGNHGDEVSDWLQAEKELKGAS